jgi:hypothetical protein
MSNLDQNTQTVPLEPTEAMLEAFHKAMLDWLNEKGEDGDVYKAMLSAYNKENE